jgi:RND family efflux transporter MFP subunit
VRPLPLVLVVVAVACADRAPALPDAGPAPAPPRSAAAEPEPEYVGVVVADKAAQVTAQRDGRLAEVRVRVGDHVQKGQSLAALDVRTLRLDLDAARAAAESAKAEAERSHLDLSELREKAARAGKLKEREAVSQEEAAGARYQERQAEARWQRAKADAAGAEARARQVEVALTDAEIRAPFDGVVSARYVDPGASVTTVTPIVRLIAADKVWVRFALPEERARALAAGAKVSVRLDTLGATFDGTVENVAPEVDTAARLVFAEARLDLPEAWQKKVPPGAAVRVAVAR